MAFRAATPAEQLTNAIILACGMDPCDIAGISYVHHVGSKPVLTVTLANGKDIDADGHPLPPVRWVPES